MLLTPIAPHMLTNRPVVVPGASDVRVEPLWPAQRRSVRHLRRPVRAPLQAGDVIEIRRAERPLRLVRAATRSYFEVLRQKLKWTER